MSFQFDDKGGFNGEIELNKILHAVESGALVAPSQSGRRSRRRNARARIAQSSLLAPILAAEGCLVTGKNELPLTAAPETFPDTAQAEAKTTPAPDTFSDPIPAEPELDDDGGGHGDDGGDHGDHGGGHDNGGGGHGDDGGGDHGDHGGGGHSDGGGGHGDHGDDGGGGHGDHGGGDHGDDGGGGHGDHGGGGHGDDGGGGHGDHGGGDHGDDGGGGHGDHGGDHGDHGDDGGGGHDGHGDTGDSGGENDHQHSGNAPLLALVPVAEATHVAVNSGSWFDPNSWANGEVPGEGAKVVIPDGVTIDYDGESAVSLFTVRVDGALNFATDVDTFMEVDTLVVSPTGHLTIGTEDNPVQAGVEAVIQIADNGPIDVAWDPMLLSRGVISQGNVEIHGGKKDTFLKVAADPMAGDTSLTLETAPDGWRVGDKLVLTGTHYKDAPEVLPGEKRDITTEDEELTITRIEGNVIYFDKPLEFDHEGPRADLKAYVANFTRNVRFETENADNVPVHERGHVMFMHSENIDVRYAEFSGLGRTDKSERAIDIADVTDVASDTNIKARYPLHLHHAGVGDGADPAMLVGNAVWGSPGWGIVHHDSNAILADNAAYDVFGAAIVAETGNETGRWIHNIAIKSIGVGGLAKDAENVAAFDLGRTGAGFWFQGRLVDAIDNVAAGVPGGHGFIYMTRGPLDEVIAVTSDIVSQSETLRYHDDSFITTPAISQFSGNEAFATLTGFEVIKNNSEQGHDVRSVIEDFTAWEVRNGILLQYTAHYTLKDIDLVATDLSASVMEPFHGIRYGKNVFDVTINGANIDGFINGVDLTKLTINLNFPFDGNFGFVFIDTEVSGAVNDFVNRDAGELFLTRADLVDGRLLFDSDIDGIPLAPLNYNDPWVDLSGVKTDSIGDARVSQSWDPNDFNNFSLRGAVETEGYWTLPDGRNVTVFDQYIADRATGELIKTSVFVEIPPGASLVAGEGFVRTTPEYHGVLDLSNEAPVAVDDIASVDENSPLTIDLLANDSDPDGDPLNIDGLVQPDHGFVVDNQDGTVTYTPDPDYTGQDEFWYWVEDDAGNLTKAQVLVTVEM